MLKQKFSYALRVFLTKKQGKFLKKIATRENASMSAVIRHAIDELQQKLEGQSTSNR